MSPLLLAALAGAILVVWAGSRGRGALGPATGGALVVGAAASASQPILAAALGVVALGMATLVARATPSRHDLLVAAMLLGMVFCAGYLSGGEGAPGDSPSWFARFGLSKEAAEAMVVGARKVIHFTAYGLLATLAARAGGRRIDPIFGIGLAFTVAVFDESRQFFTPHRSGSPWDVLLDMAGAATFLWFTRSWAARKRGVSAPETAPTPR